MRKKPLILVPIAATFLLGWWLTPPTPSAEVAPAAAAPPPSLAPPRQPPLPADPVQVDEVECPFVADGPTGPLVLTELDPDTLEPRGERRLRSRDGALHFQPSDAELGAGRIDGHELPHSVHIVWAAGVCTELVHLPAPRRLDLTVTLEDDPPGVMATLTCPRGNGWRQGETVRFEGGVAHLDTPLGQGCVISLLRHHGSLYLKTDPVPVAATTAPQQLTLAPPALPRTGLGAYASDGAVRVDAIAPGSRAERAGLQLRDLLWPEAPVDDLEAWLDTDGPLWVEVERDGELFEVEL